MCVECCVLFTPLQESAVAKHFVALSTNEVCAADTHVGGGVGGGDST